MTNSQRKLVEEVYDRPMPQIEVRAPPVFVQVERISCDIPVSAGSHQGIVRIVNSVRPGVGNLEVQPLAKSLMEHALQPIVGGVADRFDLDRLEECEISGDIRQTISRPEAQSLAG